MGSALQADLARIADGMELYRSRITARRLIRGIKGMTSRFKFALSLPGEIDKLFDAVEGDAKEMITKAIPAVHAKRANLKAKAADKIGLAGQAIGAVDKMLDELDAALEGDNGDPTDGDSSGGSQQPQDSPKAGEPALPKAGTIAAPGASPGHAMDTPRKFGP